MHKFLLRLPASLWLAIVEQAKENGRSANQEIVYRLRQSLEGYRRL